MSAEQQIVEVVLTGGPCAGKSTSLAYLAQNLADRGVRMLGVPEIATMLVQSGLSDLAEIAETDMPRFTEIERQMIIAQGDLRRRYREVARQLAPAPVVIVYDRAEMDAMAYLGAERFTAILAEEKLTLTDVRDSYDCVIHLVTAADGAAEHYTTANNEARRETAVEAVQADRRTLQAWLGHPKLWVCDNSVPFDRKLRRVLDAVLHALGKPAAEIERKFLLEGPVDFTNDELQTATRVRIEQTYLTCEEPGVEMRVRKRSQNGQHSYFLTVKRDRPDGDRDESERMISPTEFMSWLEHADPARAAIVKDRYCFNFRQHHCEMDVFQAGHDGLVLLEVELLSADEPVQLPGWAAAARDVTDDPAYRNSRLAVR